MDALDIKYEELKAYSMPMVLDGTNEDDLHMYRPGMRVLVV